MVGSSVVTRTVNLTNESLIELAIYNPQFELVACPANEIEHGDYATVSRFSMALANTGTDRITVNGVNITFNQLSNECDIIQSTLVLDEDNGFPIILYPRSYWNRHVDCPSRKTLAVSIRINTETGEVNYGTAISFWSISPKFDVWDDWSTYQHYKNVTHPNLTPISVECLLGGSLVLGIWFKKRQNMKKQ